MSFEEKKYLYAVVLDGVWYTTKFEIAKESEKIYFLANGSAVHKDIMHDFMSNVKMWYYADKKEADRVLRIKECSFLLNKYANGRDCETRFDAIKLANADEVANMFIDMIHELCEDGVPSADYVKEWLLSEPDKGQNVAACDNSEQEDYSNLKDGDTIYYVDFASNKVRKGTIYGVRRYSHDNTVTFLSLEFVDDFMGINGEFLGKELFINEILAYRALRRGKKNV
jgi:hypothetical protein